MCCWNSVKAAATAKGSHRSQSVQLVRRRRRHNSVNSARRSPEDKRILFILFYSFREITLILLEKRGNTQSALSFPFPIFSSFFPPSPESITIALCAAKLLPTAPTALLLLPIIGQAKRRRRSRGCDAKKRARLVRAIIVEQKQQQQQQQRWQKFWHSRHHCTALKWTMIKWAGDRKKEESLKNMAAKVGDIH